MKTRIAALLMILATVEALSVRATWASDNTMPGNATPILVELFTSEGCSSCPPADALLQQLDRTQSLPGARVIVLSEHVDYWNSLGWKDPFSSAFFSDRQGSYARRFAPAGPYTPQMVVDGGTECLGSDARLANQAIEKAERGVKIPVRVSSVAWDGSGTLRAHVDAGPFAAASHARKAGIYLVAALDHAESQVARGENSGRRLTHVAVVLSLTQIGLLEEGKSFSQDVQIRDVQTKPEAGGDSTHLRVIAFVQESGPGRVLGAAVEQASQ